MVKVGFIGVGGIAGAHLNNLAGIADAKLTAYADINLQRANDTAAKYGGTAYSDWKEMLEKEQLDVVYVCVPPMAHGEAERAVVRKGLALFVEKPLDINVANVLATEKIVNESGVITGVGYHWRYMQETEFAVNALAGTDVAMALGWWNGGMPGVAWWRAHDLSGGQFVEQTTHIVDMARYVVGEVDAVYASMARRTLTDVENFTTYDVGVVNLEFASGAVGNISNTSILNKGGGKVGIEFYARDLHVEVLDGGRVHDGQLTTIRKADWGFNAYRKEDEVFIQAVKTGDRSGVRSDYSEGVKTLLVTLAANLSAKEQRRVTIAELLG